MRTVVNGSSTSPRSSRTWERQGWAGLLGLVLFAWPSLAMGEDPESEAQGAVRVLREFVEGGREDKLLDCILRFGRARSHEELGRAFQGESRRLGLSWEKGKEWDEQRLVSMLESGSPAESSVASLGLAALALSSSLVYDYAEAMRDDCVRHGSPRVMHELAQVVRKGTNATARERALCILVASRDVNSPERVALIVETIQGVRDPVRELVQAELNASKLCALIRASAGRPSESFHCAWALRMASTSRDKDVVVTVEEKVGELVKTGLAVPVADCLVRMGTGDALRCLERVYDRLDDDGRGYAVWLLCRSRVDGRGGVLASIVARSPLEPAWSGRVIVEGVRQVAELCDLAVVKGVVTEIRRRSSESGQRLDSSVNDALEKLASAGRGSGQRR